LVLPYWVPVPLEYLTAVGAAVAQWGYFEMQFDGLLVILKRNPQAAAAAAKVKTASFQGRAEALRKIAAVAFAASPALVKKVRDFSIRAYETCKKRNILVHGFWFDMMSFDAARGVEIMTAPDGTGDFYTVPLPEIELLAQKIVDLKKEGVRLIFPPSMGGKDMPPDELAALQKHHADFPPPPGPVPIQRKAGAKGTPRQPAPFRA
jgi:hypothetical protein